MMTNGDISQQHLNPNTQPNNPQSALLHQCLAFSSHQQYGAGNMGNLPFLPNLSTHPQVNNPSGQPMFPDFSSTNPYYYTHQPNLNQSSRPAPTISPIDLKFPLNGSLDTIRDGGAQTAASSTDGSSPFDANGSGGIGNNAFYNQIFPDNYLSAAMGGTDAYPSTSFMGMNPYSHAYYTYPTAPSSHQTQSALSSAAAMDFMQSHQNSMLNQWKYSAGTEKLSKSISHGIKSSSTSSLSNRQSNPPHKIGPGTNNVRVRTLDKYRTVYTDRQRLELEKEFRSHQFVTTERKAVLAGELQLTERQVKIWFQNRRAKSRKQEPSHRSLRMSAMTR